MPAPSPSQIRQARESRKQTQLQAAIEINVRPETWSSWERGRSTPQGASLANLVAYLRAVESYIAAANALSEGGGT